MEILLRLKVFLFIIDIILSFLAYCRMLRTETDTQTEARIHPAFPAERVNSIEEGIVAMDRSDSLFAYIPLQMTPEVEHLRDTIEQNALAFLFQFSAHPNAVAAIKGMYAEAGIPFDSLPVKFSHVCDYPGAPLMMEPAPGIPLLAKDSDQPFHFSADSHPDLCIGRFLMQANNIKFSLEGEHQDESTQVTVNIYLSGKGMAYKVGHNFHRLKPPIVTIHRGTDHPLALKNPDLAVPHRGYDHPEYDPNIPGSGRANMIITMSDRDEVRRSIMSVLNASMG